MTKKMLDARCWMLVTAMVVCLFIGASFPLQVGSAQFIDRIIRPCSSGIVPRAQVIANPNNTGNVQITTCTGGSVTINGTAIVPGGGTINTTNTFIPYRLNATTFSDSPLARTSATVITSTAAFNGPGGGVNTATYSFAAEPTLGWIRGAAGQLTATSGGTIGWFDINGWHGFGTKVEVFNDTATSTDGFIATTNGNATVGVQKLSPRIRLSGSGWKTDAAAGAQMTDWIIENTPVQGTANPSTNLVFSSQVNAGGYTSRVALTSAGNVGIGTVGPGYQLTILRRAGSTITDPLLNLQSQTSGSIDGDSFILMGTQAANWSVGVDQADLSKFKIEPASTLGGSTGLTITTSGNVGIGDVDPVALFTVGNGDLFQVSSLGVPTAPAYKTSTNCADSAGAAACGSAAAGAVVIDAGSTSVVVSTTAITATSRVMVVFDSSLGTELGVICNTTAALPFVTARTAATSFTISVGVAPAVNPGCFTYWIVN